MSKKASIIVSAALFVVLVGLLVCEQIWPEAGSDFVFGLFG